MNVKHIQRFATCDYFTSLLALSKGVCWLTTVEPKNKHILKNCFPIIIQTPLFVQKNVYFSQISTTSLMGLL